MDNNTNCSAQPEFKGVAGIMFEMVQRFKQMLSITFKYLFCDMWKMFLAMLKVLPLNGENIIDRTFDKCESFKENKKSERNS